MKKCIISIIFLLFLGSMAQAQFVVYREFRFPGAPAESYFDGLGFKRSHGIYEDEVTGGSPPVEQSRMVSTAQRTASNYSLYQNRFWYDIEYLKTDAKYVGNAVAAANARELAKFIGWAKKAVGSNYEVGIYSMVPCTDLYMKNRLAERQAWNDLLQPLADSLDWLCPSIYLYYAESKVSYASYALPMVTESKRLAKGKKVYAMVSPGYHWAGDFDNKWASYSVWMNVLNTLKGSGVDGIIIYAGQDKMGSQPSSWSYIDTCSWWRATKDFMKTLGTSPSLLPAPSIISPTSGLRVTPTNFTARWRRVSGALKYQVQLARASSFSTPVFSDSAITDTLRRFTGLTKGANYWFRVRTRSGAGWGSWSPIVAFSTSSTLKPGEDDDSGLPPEVTAVPEVFSLAQNYPNPFNPSTAIRFSLPVAAHVRLTVFNSLGQEVQLLVDEVREAGYHEVRLDATGDMASGVYFYRMQAGDFIETRKLCLLK